MRKTDDKTKMVFFLCDSCGESLTNSEFHFCGSCGKARARFINTDQILKLRDFFEEKAWNALHYSHFVNFSHAVSKWTLLNRLLPYTTRSKNPFSLLWLLHDENMRNRVMLFLEGLRESDPSLFHSDNDIEEGMENVERTDEASENVT